MVSKEDAREIFTHFRALVFGGGDKVCPIRSPLEIGNLHAVFMHGLVEQ